MQCDGHYINASRAITQIYKPWGWWLVPPREGAPAMRPGQTHAHGPRQAGRAVRPQPGRSRATIGEANVSLARAEIGAPAGAAANVHICVQRRALARRERWKARR